MNKHYRTYAGLATTEYGERGITLRLSKNNVIQLLMHNGCGSGNMVAVIGPELALSLATDLLNAYRAQQERVTAVKAELKERLEAGARALPA